jgi:glycerate-2-kinase
MRRDLIEIAEAGILAVEPRKMLSSLMAYNEDFNSVKVFNRSYDLIKGRIFVIGGGKAAGAMAEAVEKVIGPIHITAGLVNCKDSSYDTKVVKVMKAGHPFPDWRSLFQSRRMMEFKNKYAINEKDLVICLISGGASTMLAAPVPGVSLRDKQKATKLLISSGAAIDEINIVRKHLSRIKGGLLAAHFAPARVLTLVISDVLGNKLETIGSGPTVPDPGTFKDAKLVLDNYELWSKMPKSVARHIELGCQGKAQETPKELANADNFVVGSNQSALESMAHRAVSLGLRPVIVSDTVKGDPNVMAYKVVRHIAQEDYQAYDVLLYAGETNPKLPEKYGRGGRNQQFAAACMLALRSLKTDWAMASISTDGIDYDLSVAGAMVDRESYRLAEKKGIDVPAYVRTYDTYRLFRKMGASHIRTGHTGTNVADLMIFRLGRRAEL